MNIQAKHIVAVAVSTLLAGWTAYVSNFHPGVSVLAGGGMIVNLLNLLMQSPYLVAPEVPAPSPVSAENLPRTGPFFVKEPKGFVSLSALLIAIAVSAAILFSSGCTQQEARTVEKFALTVEQDICANEAIIRAINPIAAEVVAGVCGIAAPFIPLLQDKIDAHKFRTNVLPIRLTGGDAGAPLDAGHAN